MVADDDRIIVSIDAADARGRASEQTNERPVEYFKDISGGGMAEGSYLVVAAFNGGGNGLYK